MACSTEFINFICSQLEGMGMVRARKMFGDFCIYIDEKPMILACDEMAFIKKHEAIVEMMKDAEVVFPYEGAREHYILNMENKEDVQRIIRTLFSVIPYPKSKKKETIRRSNTKT